MLPIYSLHLPKAHKRTWVLTVVVVGPPADDSFSTDRSSALVRTLLLRTLAQWRIFGGLLPLNYLSGPRSERDLVKEEQSLIKTNAPEHKKERMNTASFLSPFYPFGVGSTRKFYRVFSPKRHTRRRWLWLKAMRRSKRLNLCEKKTHRLALTLDGGNFHAREKRRNSLRHIVNRWHWACFESAGLAYMNLHVH